MAATACRLDPSDLGAGSQTVFFGKNNPDEASLQVTVKPPVALVFGEDHPPRNAVNIKPGWKKRG